MAAKKVVKMNKKDTFVINDKEYKACDFDINMVCDMQDIGFDPMTNTNKILQFLRAYLAICSGTYDLVFAGKELTEHLKKYNNFDELREVLEKKVSESGFFRTTDQTTEETSAAAQTAESEEAETE